MPVILLTFLNRCFRISIHFFFNQMIFLENFWGYIRTASKNCWILYEIPKSVRMKTPNAHEEDTSIYY